MLFEGKIAGSGFTQVPGGPNYRNRSCFSFHYYCGSFVSDWEDKPVEQKLICDHVTGPLVMEAVKKDLKTLGGAQMMTEGIACGDNKTECATVMGMLDDHLFSYTSYADSQGSTFDPDPSMQAAWARTYARAIAGMPISMHFDPISKKFEFCFEMDTSITEPTEIFASLTYSYTSGRNITTSSNLIVSKSSGDSVQVVPSDDAKNGDHACVYISKD
jgi:endoglycosylceramidase|tara:strand:+ start:438 stop:1085 length:648 start_codon:yes stop_codon:yes gene_type:complete